MANFCGGSSSQKAAETYSPLLSVQIHWILRPVTSSTLALYFQNSEEGLIFPLKRFDCVICQLIEHNNVTNMTFFLSGNLECHETNMTLNLLKSSSELDQEYYDMLTVLVKTRYEVTCTIVSRSPKGSANITLHHGPWSHPSLAPLKMCYWPLNSSRNHFGLHQEKNVRVPMELEVPKRPISKLTLSTVTLQWVLWWERQKGFSCCNRQGTMA
jgi:hypothetical protein